MINKTGKGNIMDTDYKHSFCGEYWRSKRFWFCRLSCKVRLGRIERYGGNETWQCPIKEDWWQNLSCARLPFFKKWLGKNQAEVIKQCFDNIDIDDSEEIASIAIGTGFVGMLTGANPREIVCGCAIQRKI